MKCERPSCKNQTTSDLRYCSDECFDADNDVIPVDVSFRAHQTGAWRRVHIGPVVPKYSDQL